MPLGAGQETPFALGLARRLVDEYGPTAGVRLLDEQAGEFPEVGEPTSGITSPIWPVRPWRR